MDVGKLGVDKEGGVREVLEVGFTNVLFKLGSTEALVYHCASLAVFEPERS